MVNTEIINVIFTFMISLTDEACGNESNRQTNTEKGQGHSYRRNCRFALKEYKHDNLKNKQDSQKL